MSKYSPLHQRLIRAGESLSLPFDEVADLVGGLPASAFKYAAWWNNDDPSHSHSRSWSDAGYRAEVDLAARIVRFTPKAD